MSSINKALSELTEKDASIDLVRASVPELPKRKPWLWLVAGFGLSLTLGSWAVSQGRETPAQHNVITSEIVTDASPTRKATPKTANIHIANLDSQKVTKPIVKSKVIPKAIIHQKTTTQNENSTEKQTLAAKQQVATQPSVVNAESIAVTLNTANTNTANTNVIKANANLDNTNLGNADTASTAIDSNDTNNQKLADGHLDVEQVSLTGKQLALKAQDRAQKAIDSNDMQTALDAYEEALRYDPYAVIIRQKLAALYYGKNDTRHAYDILQAGIRLDESNQVLRLSLAKMLIKAKQVEAALSPLVYMPTNPSQDYLSMRAALAQKSKHNDIALASYQMLTKMDPDNARWWLGLAIQQERAVQFKVAITAYQKALGLVGISNQSQVFIHDRLKLLKQLEKAQ